MLAVFVIEHFKLRLFFGGKRDYLKLSITYFTWSAGPSDESLKLSRMSWMLWQKSIPPRGWERWLVQPLC